MKAGILPTCWRGEGGRSQRPKGAGREGWRMTRASVTCPLPPPRFPPASPCWFVRANSISITHWLPPQNPGHSLETRSWPSVQVGAWLGFSEGTRKIQPHEPAPASGGWPAAVGIFSGGSAGIALAAGLSTPTSGFTVSWRSLCKLVCV